MGLFQRLRQPVGLCSGVRSAEAPLCFGDGGGRDGFSVQLPSQRKVGVWVALGIPFAHKTQASGRLRRRNLFNLQICFNKVIFTHC